MIAHASPVQAGSARRGGMGEVVDLGGARLTVALSSDEATNFVRRAAQHYRDLHGERDALNALLASVRAVLEADPNVRAAARARNEEVYRTYLDLTVAQRATLQRVQDTIQRIRDQLTYVYRPAGYASREQMMQAYGFGALPLLLLAGALFVGALGGAAAGVLYVGAEAVERVLLALAGESAEARTARASLRRDVRADLERTLRQAGVAETEIVRSLGRYDAAVVEGPRGSGLSLGWVAALGLVAAVGGFFGGRVTR